MYIRTYVCRTTHQPRQLFKSNSINPNFMKLGHIAKYYVFFKFDNGEYPTLPSRVIAFIHQTMSYLQSFFQQFWEKAPGQNWEKMINLTSKLGEINTIEHNEGSKIYPQNQVILDCIMSSIPLKHTFSQVVVVSKKSIYIFFFYFS